MNALLDFLVENDIESIIEDVILLIKRHNKMEQHTFKIKALNSATLDDIRAKCKGKKGEFDESKFAALLVAEACILPNFKDAKSMDKIGCHTPEQFIKKILLAGERDELSKRIVALCGYDIDPQSVIQDAKN